MESPSENKVHAIWFVTWLAFSAALVYVISARSVGADRSVAITTVCLGLFSATIAIPLGAVAAWVASGRGWLSRAVLAACVCLLIVPVFVHVSAWDSAFGRLGWLTATEGLTLKPLVSGWVSAVWIHAIAATPQVAIIMLLGLSMGRRTFEEQALLETGRAAVFWHVTLPRLSPLVLLSAVWIMLTCSREIAVSDIYRIGTLAEQVYLGFSLGQFNSIRGNWTPQQIADAQSLGSYVTIAVVGWIIVTSIWFFSRMTSLEFDSSQWQPDSIGRTRSSVAKKIFAVALLLIMVMVPAGNLLYRASFSVESIGGIPVPTHSVAQFVAVIGRVFTQYQTEFAWSTLIGAVSATLILCVVTVFTWLACQSPIAKAIFILGLTFSCAIPGPLFGSWLSQLFSSLTNATAVWLYDRTICAPVIASFFFCWPLSALIVWFVFRKTAVDCLESSRLEGASGIQQLFGIVMTGNKRVLFGCWLISFALCFGELSTSQMVLPPGMDTVPRTTLGLLHAGVDEMTAALTIVTVALIIILSWLGWCLIGLNPASHSRQ
jgi:ABC-type Fe3+ transport system permease subunit